MVSRFGQQGRAVFTVGQRDVELHDQLSRQFADLQQSEVFADAVVRSDGEGCERVGLLDQFRPAGPTFGDEVFALYVTCFIWRAFLVDVLDLFVVVSKGGGWSYHGPSHSLESG